MELIECSEKLAIRTHDTRELPKRKHITYRTWRKLKIKKVFNSLPTGIKSLSGDVRKFKLALKRFLLEGSFYTIQEYFDWKRS